MPVKDHTPETTEGEKEGLETGVTPLEAAPGFPARRADLLALLSLPALHIAFFWQAALLRGFLVHADLCYWFEPYASLLHTSLRAGRLPLWSPYVLCGYPVAAEGQIAAFYPLSLLFARLLPGPAAINWMIISHLIIAGVFTYLLARALRFSPFPSWLSAVVFSFSGVLFAHLIHPNMICAAVWLPATILFIERAWRQRLLPNAAWASLVWAASALAGHPQTTFFISLTVCFWVFWKLTVAQSASGDEYREWRRAAAMLAIVFVLGGALAAVQLLPTAELSGAAPHGQSGDLRYITSFSLLPQHLLGLLAPNWQGTPAFASYRGEPNYWEYVLYLGLVPLALACLGAANRRGRAVVGLCLVALLLALAEGNPLYYLLRYLPGFADFRAPARWVLIFTFGAALLVAYGWERLARSRWLASRFSMAIAGALVASLTCADLISFDRTLAPLASPAVLESQPPAVQALRRDPDWWRVVIAPPQHIGVDWVPPGGWARNPDGWRQAREALAFDVPQSLQLRILGGYRAFADLRYESFLRTAYDRAFQWDDLSLLSLVGTRYLLLSEPLTASKLPVISVAPFWLYRNPDALPRAFVVGEVVQADQLSNALDLTAELARTKRLRETAVVEGKIQALKSSGRPTATLEIRQPRPEHIIIQAQSDRNSLLVLNERWDAGWRARIDGHATALVTVDTVLMGASLPAGRHAIEFVYRPRGFIVGRAVSLCALPLWALLVLTARFPRRSPRPVAGTDPAGNVSAA